MFSALTTFDKREMPSHVARGAIELRDRSAGAKYIIFI
jgi:hypothetical protein